MTDEIFLEFQRSQSQYLYFLLGIAGASVAFAITQTSGKPLIVEMVPIGIAVALWAASFFSGLVATQRRGSALRLNQIILELQASEETESNTALLGKLKKSDLFGNWVKYQRWLFFFGALAYLAGHIWIMWAATATRGSTAGPPQPHCQSSTMSSDKLVTPASCSALEKLPVPRPN